MSGSNRWKKQPLSHTITPICTKKQFLFGTLITYTTNFTTRFRPIPLIVDFNPTYIDPDYGRDPLWDTELSNQDLLQFQHDLDGIELNNTSVHDLLITHNKKTSALKQNWEINDGTIQCSLIPLGPENIATNVEPTPQSLLDDKQS